jgi:hypothetical protein
LYCKTYDVDVSAKKCGLNCAECLKTALDKVGSLERDEQSLLIEWCDMMSARIPGLNMIYHIPNGGSRNKAEAANLKKQGVRPGVPDLCLPIASRGYHGLYIEMKTKDGVTSKDQKDWIMSLREQGYAAKVCRGFEDAKEFICKYLEVEGW